MAAASHPHRLIVGALLVAMVPLGIWATMRHLEAAERVEAIAATVPQETRPGYATSNRCEACHPSQYASWHRGYHRTMTTYASPATVRGTFDGVQQGGGYGARLYRTGDDFMVEMYDPLFLYEVDFGQRPPPEPGQTPPLVDRRISMVTGSHHMQAYWVPSMSGNGQMSLPFTYLLEDKRWVPRGDVFLHPPGGRHQEQVWNVSCIRCHSTGGQPLANVAGQEVVSRVGELGIACEACHGPAEAHISANQNPMRRYLLHLKGEGDPTIVNPARLPASRASEVCGQCHSLTDVTPEIELGQGKAYVPGDELEKTQPLLRPLHSTPALVKAAAEDPSYMHNYFWADGTIRVSSRDYSGMIESKCMQSGTLWCGTCHSLHDSDPVNLLAKDKETDAACATCHPTIAASVETHTHHKGGSIGSRCYNCHMPYTVYGLLKGIRNHRIDSPVVTGRVGGSERPNACNLCHVDKSLSWTAQQLATWFGKPVVEGLSTEPAAIEWLLSGDAVLRAIAAWQFGWEGARAAAPVIDAVPYLVTELDDPYAAVRYVAGHALAKIIPGVEFDYLGEPEARRRSADEYLKRWREQHPGDTSAIDARIKQLIGRRDDSPVRAME